MQATPERLGRFKNQTVNYLKTSVILKKKMLALSKYSLEYWCKQYAFLFVCIILPLLGHILSSNNKS